MTTAREGRATALRDRSVPGSAHAVDVCVVGAGPVGAALACFLAWRGATVAVVDRQALPPMEHPAFDGRAYAIAAGSRRRLLEPAGVWARLPFPSGPINAIRVTDGRPGRPPSPLRLDFDAERDGDGAPFGFMVEARSLRVALNATLHATPSIALHAPDEASLLAMDRERATLALRDGRTVSCRLLVAAEGRRSALRARAGIRVTERAYAQAGLVTAIAHERPHEGRALEHFLPGGPFAVLPMAPTADAEHVSAVVWTEEADRARRLASADASVFAHEIRRRLAPASTLGAARPIGRRWLYPLSALHAERFVDDRLALVGDAAHGIHPIAGQGLNLGFRDAIMLGELVADALGRGDDPGAPALLARYQAARRPDSLAMLLATDALDRLFSHDGRLRRLVRDLGLAAVDRAGPLKRRFVATASGA